jgi:hypothetical protein
MHIKEQKNNLFEIGFLNKIKDKNGINLNINKNSNFEKKFKKSLI